MLLPGCQCCGTSPCPECRHYTVDTFDNSLTATVTINGYSIPVYTGDFFPEYEYLSIPSEVQSNCFVGYENPKRAGFYAEFQADSAFREYFEVSGCPSVRVLLRIYVVLPESQYYGPNSRLALQIEGYDIPANCTDTGGTATTSQSWYFWGNDQFVDENCTIALLDWLSTLTVVTTFAFDPCECPP